MTPQDVVNTVWDILGRPDDIPTDDVRWLDVLNGAQNRIATWKDPTTGYPVELFELVDSTNKMVGPFVYKSAGTPTDAAHFARVGNEITGGPTIDQNVNHLIDVKDHLRTIVAVEPNGDYHHYVAFNRNLPAPVVDIPPDTASFDVTVYRRGFELDTGMIDIYNVENLTERYRLEIGNPKQPWVELAERVGRPSRWFLMGRSVWFDSAPRERVWFRVEYFRMPRAITDLEESSFEVPAIFHEGIVLLAAEWGYRRYGESNEKYSIKRDFIDFMRSARGEYDRQYTRHQGKIERR